jgi:23S rRNA pseudouridine1911/1915/1917 synthase
MLDSDTGDGRTRTDDGPQDRRLDAAVRERFSVSWGEARRRIYGGKITVDGAVVIDIGHPTPIGAALEYVSDAKRPKPIDALLPKEAIVFLDRDIAVVEKPADLLTVPFERGDRPTLDQLLRSVLARRDGGRSARAGRPPVFVVHRLDKGTSGLLVFALNQTARAGLKEQFRDHTAHRRYLAIVHGRTTARTLESHLLADRGDGLRGSAERARPGRRASTQGKRAVTHVEVLDSFSHASLLSCRLETGRTNQIRIHLSEIGHPLLGETIYLRGFPGRVIQAPRLCLHAAELGFTHPRTAERMMFESPMPEAMRAVLRGLG